MGTFITIVIIIVLISLFAGKKKAPTPPAVKFYDRKPESNLSLGQSLDGMDWKVTVSIHLSDYCIPFYLIISPL